MEYLSRTDASLAGQFTTNSVKSVWKKGKNSSENYRSFSRRYSHTWCGHLASHRDHGRLLLCNITIKVIIATTCGCYHMECCWLVTQGEASGSAYLRCLLGTGTTPRAHSHILSRIISTSQNWNHEGLGYPHSWAPLLHLSPHTQVAPIIHLRLWQKKSNQCLEKDTTPELA